MEAALINPSERSNSGRRSAPINASGKRSTPTKKSVLGILGTAKNTGKTTTTTALLEQVARSKLSIGLTSIGYDGEDIDNITELPKPRIRVREGTLIATAEQCLEAGTAGIKKLKETGLSTPLGRIIIGEIVDEGLVVLAGPNKGRDLSAVIKELKALGGVLIFVDGALNRIVPLMKTEALVVTTGASRNTSIDFLAAEAQSIYKVFRIPRAEAKVFSAVSKGAKSLKTITLIRGDGALKRLEIGALIRPREVQALAMSIDRDTEVVVIPGLLVGSALKRLLGECREMLQGKKIIIQNPANLLIGSDPISLLQMLNLMEAAEIRLQALETVPVLAITVNPFYPLYNRYGDNKYEMAWINREELYHKIKSAVELPVIDIVHEGGSRLFDLLREEFAL